MTVYVRLMGGLGNQIFQLSAAISLTKTNDEDIVIFDSSSNRDTVVVDRWYAPLLMDGRFRIERKGHFRLENFLLRERLAHRDFSSTTYRLAEKLVEWHIKSKFREDVRVFTPNNLGYQAIVQEQVSVYVNGYFQTYKYLSEKPEIAGLISSCLNQRECQVVSRNIETIYKEGGGVAIHVRLGDYLLNPHFGNLDGNYFKKCLSFISEAFGLERIYLYSDDIRGARDLLSFLPQPLVVLDECSHGATCVLRQMIHHNLYVISNSSFGWWAAFLSSQDPKMVIAPTPWFKEIDIPDSLIPPDWNTMPATWR